MTSVTGSDLGGHTQLTRRLSILPTLLGLAAVIVIAATGFLAGVAPAGSGGAALVLVGAACVGTTIVWGHPVGLYVGLTLVVIAALVDEGSLSSRSLIITAIGLLLAHEVARPAIDARRPARFGSGVWLHHGLRTLGLASLLAAAGWLGARAETLTVPDAWVPAGLALAALPLLARRAVSGPTGVGDGRRELGPWFVRAAIGSVVAVAAIAGSILGAGARAGLIDEGGGTADSVASSSAPSTTAPRAPLDDAAVIEGGVSVVLFFLAMLLVGFLYVALRRREMTFDLDELDMDSGDSLLGLAGPAQADLEDTQVEIDERTMRRLLDELALDLATERDPGRAIRFAYANIEQRLAEIEIVRAETETEQEFLTRALPSLGTDGRAMVALTTLFEQARFGHTPVSESMRSDALDAVQVLRAATRTAERSDPDPGHAASDRAYPPAEGGHVS
ncbi:MAG: DUF4129 domain-containing protein [Acidimicrobiia bacterium]|nr:DUF4129 domain-containing protein [Acidimicrobiia bacterium]